MHKNISILTKLFGFGFVKIFLIQYDVMLPEGLSLGSILFINIKRFK